MGRCSASTAIRSNNDRSEDSRLKSRVRMTVGGEKQQGEGLLVF